MDFTNPHFGYTVNALSYTLLTLGLLIGFMMGLFFYAIICIEFLGVGIFESLNLIIEGGIIDQYKKSRLRKGDTILLKTKYGLYPARIALNRPEKKEIMIDGDKWMYWTSWHYKDIELIDTEIKRTLYGRF